MADEAIKRNADKQLDTMYQTVDKLNEVGFPKFKQLIERQAYCYEWPKFILDRNVEVPDELDLKQQRDVRNAYLLIMRKADGHPVESSLEQIEVGNARLAFRAVHNHFNPDTQAGRTACYKQLYTATMANTGSNILQWAALVPRRAKILIESGGEATESAQLFVLMDGLLPEFEKIKDILQDKDELTWLVATRKLIGYAQSHNLETLTKDGRNGKTDTVNTFTIQDSEECNNWKLGKCRYGKKCFRKHVGPGGCLPDAGSQPRKNRPQHGKFPQPPPTAPKAFVVGGQVPSGPECHNCKGLHSMKDCPNANVFTFDSEKGVDYVFVTQTIPESENDPITMYADTDAISDSDNEITDSDPDDSRSCIRDTGLPADPPGALRGPCGANTLQSLAWQHCSSPCS